MPMRWISVAFLVCGCVGMLQAAGDAPGSVQPSPSSRPAVVMRNVYVCDASNEMARGRGTLITGIKDAIGRLREPDALNVILFNQKAITVYSPQLSPATPETKKQLTKDGGWIDKSFELAEAGDPVAAIEVAFAQRPQIIYFSTCGFSQYKDAKAGEKLQMRVRELNVDRAVRIHTVLLQAPSDGPTVAAQKAAEDAAMLKAISDENRGHLRLAPIDAAKTERSRPARSGATPGR